jgi:hypothetical protein
MHGIEKEETTPALVKKSYAVRKVPCQSEEVVTFDMIMGILVAL